MGEDGHGTLRQRWPVPARPRPIISIGGGGIVRDAHYPAYQALGLRIAGVYDLDPAQARKVSEQFGVPFLEQLPTGFAAEDVVYDVATPPEAIPQILTKLPRGAAVLVQKPMGRNLDEASAILSICGQRELTVAVNFQLRFSPMMLALADLVQRGEFGTLTDCEVRVHCAMPWEFWPFLRSLDRLEFALHSIHYLDTLRALLGEPRGVFARTLQHPEATDLASTRSSAIFEFDPAVRASMTVNHHHRFGSRFACSELRLEGTAAAAVVKMGVNLRYPEGEPDELWFSRRDEEWRSIPLVGNWFPDAFRGPMCNLQRFVAGEDERLLTAADDAWKTMALVEACYRASATPSIPIETRPEL